MPAKSKIDIFKELYEANVELWRDIDSMKQDLELNKINSLSWILRKLICDTTRKGKPLLLDLIEQENYPIYFYAQFDEPAINWCVSSLPFWNWQSPSISLIQIDFLQKVELNEWLWKTILMIEKINYTSKDIIRLHADNKGVHADIELDAKLKTLEGLKISNDYLSDTEWYKKFLFDTGNILHTKITEFVEFFETQHKWNQDLIDFHHHKIENTSKKISINSSNPEFYYERAIFYYRIADFHSSLEDITTCLRLTPDLEKYLFQKAILLHHQKKYKEAIEIYKNIIKKWRREPDVFNNLWNVYQDNWEFDSAIEAFDNALILNDTCVFAIYGKWRTYRLKWDFQKAISILSPISWLNFQPNIDEELWLSFMESKQYNVALKYFERIIWYTSDKKVYHLHAWICLNEIREYKKAIRYFNKALDLDDDYLLAHYNKWNANLKYWEFHLKEWRNEKAVEYFEKALSSYNEVFALDPNYEFWHPNKALALYYLWYESGDIINIIDEWIKLYPKKINNFVNKLVLLKKLGLENDFKTSKDFYLEQFKWDQAMSDEIQKIKYL